MDVGIIVSLTAYTIIRCKAIIVVVRNLFSGYNLMLNGLVSHHNIMTSIRGIVSIVRDYSAKYTGEHYLSVCATITYEVFFHFMPLLCYVWL